VKNKMHCLLVIPPWDTYKYDSGRVEHPNGILYIGAVLRNLDHKVNFLDGAFYNHDAIIRKSIAYKPDLIAIYSSSFLRKSTLRYIKDIKQKMDNIFIIVGGPDSFLKEKFLELCDKIDCVVFAEGELTIREIALRLKNKKSLKGVKGCCYRGKNKKMVVNPPRELISDLDILPFPARDLLEFNKYRFQFDHFKRKPSIGITAARGCTNRCSYCFKLYPKKIDCLRYRSPKNIIDEIEECVNKYGIKDVRFWDDTFLSDQKRVLDICKEITDRSLDITWQCNARVDQVNKKILKVMKKAGCWGILYGVESGVQRNIDILNKNISLDQVKRAVKMAKETNLHVYTSFMFGVPGETFIDGLKTVKFAMSLRSDSYAFNCFTPFPGSDSYYLVNNSGRLLNDAKTFLSLSFIPSSMNVTQIKTLILLSKLLHKMDLYFRKPYSSLKHYLERINDFRDIIDVIRIYTF